MDGTILSQGTFTVGASVVNKVIQVPSSADWIFVRNYTQMATAGAAAPNSAGYEFYWQKGMAAGSAMVAYKTVTTNARVDDIILTGGITLYDPSGQLVGSQSLLGSGVATTASSNATSPVVLTASTAGLVASTGTVAGTIVRVTGTAAQPNTQGLDFAIGSVVANTSFTLTVAGLNPLANVPGAVGGAGTYRIVNAGSPFYPRRRFIANITKATQAIVTTTVQHGMTAGQVVRINIPQLSVAPLGMVEIDGQAVTIVSVTDDFTFVINVDTSAYSTFVWPSVAQSPSGYPAMIPVGEDTATSLVTVQAQVPSIGGFQINGTQSGILADAAVNTGFLGMVLGTGAAGVVLTTAITGPAGTAASDVVYWAAGKSSFGGL